MNPVSENQSKCAVSIGIRALLVSVHASCALSPSCHESLMGDMEYGCA